MKSSKLPGMLSVKSKKGLDYIRAITVLKINAHIYTLLPSSITKSYKTLVVSIKIHKSQLLLFIWIADQSLAFL